MSKKSKKEEEVADSWEDEETSDIEDVVPASYDKPDIEVKKDASRANWEDEPRPSLSSTSWTEDEPSSRKETSSDPSSSSEVYSPDGTLLSGGSGRGGGGSGYGRGSDKRPEKTDAVARRMIASALGVRPTRRTEEERAYDNALREKEKKRRDEERARRVADEIAAQKEKEDMWGS